MKRKIPSFEDCLEIVKNNECFTHRYREVNGYKVSIFNYLLASYKDFKQPIPNNPDIDAFELRGLCFTHDKDMNVVRRFLLLHKFFNLNQCEDYQYDILKNITINKVTDKMDGSIMRFIELPNGEIVVKSKTFFDNNQTKMAMDVYNKNKRLQAFVKDTLDYNLAAVFELTSPLNAIVLKYQSNNLTLLQLRDEATGEYLDLHNHPLVKKHGIDVVSQENLTLDEIISLSKTVKDKEGWVGEWADGLFKVKTDWYCERHGLLTETLNRENLLMELIVDEKIDDAIAELDINDMRRTNIENICQAYTHYLVHKLNEVKALAKRYNGDKKTWVLTNRPNPLFSFAVYLLDLKEDDWDDYLIERLKVSIKKDTYHLERAKVFIKDELKSNLLIEYSIDDLEG